jgi:hypothetical protein
MKHTKKAALLLIVLLLLTTFSLSARQRSIAVGAQLGFTTSGAIVDVGLGNLYIQGGIGYPLGISYIATFADDGDVFFNVFTFNFDISQAYALSDNFDLKLGLGTTAFTNFGPVILGVAGPVVKGEYWIPNRNMGLFVNLNIPVMAYGLVEGDSTFDGTVFFHGLLPLIGLVTSTVGVLYSF